MAYKFVGQVTEMRRLKDVLNIDFSPPKTCSYDCLYCPGGRTNALTSTRSMFYPAKDVFDEIRSYINDNGAPQHILLTGSGEPTLYAGFGELARMIKREFRNLKIIVYTNLSLLGREDVRKDIAVCDSVAGNFNTVSENEFREIYRPHESMKLQNVMDGIKRFRNEYDGVFELDTRFLKGINDNERNIKGLKAFMKKIGPSKYLVFDAKYKGQQLTNDFLEKVKEEFEDLPFTVEYHVSHNTVSRS